MGRGQYKKTRKDSVLQEPDDDENSRQDADAPSPKVRHTLFPKGQAKYSRSAQALASADSAAAMRAADDDGEIPDPGQAEGRCARRGPEGGV